MPSSDNQIDPTDETAIARLNPADQTAIARVDTADETAIAKSIDAPAPRTATPSQPVALQDDTLAPGSIFHGDFRISQSIVKRGGMGEVYKAINIINNTAFAIKMIRHDLSHDPDLVSKFIQEDEALRQLNNPAVVRYYGVRRDPESERFYIQMEYVDGPTLGEYVKERGAISAGAARMLCHHLALGLQDAHHCGIVHRDISPDNILLGNSDLAQAKIIDFGIAKVASTGDFTTFRSSFVGKYRYASPEHFSSDAPIDQRSDIYSLGLVVAAAAAGKPLEMGKDELSGATARLRVPDLSVVPVAMRPMLTRMLDPDPTRRPTAADLVVQLAPVGGRKKGGRVGLWLGLVAVVVIIAGGGGVAWLKLQPPVIPPTPPRINTGPVASPGTGTAGSSLGPAGTGTTGAGTTGAPATGTVGTIAGPTGGATTSPQVTKSVLQPTASIDAVKQAVAASPGACVPLTVSPLDSGRVQVNGLVGTQADADRVKGAVEGLGYTLDNQLVTSRSACQALQLLNQLGKVNATTGANRPILSVQKIPALFRVGETVNLSATASLNADHHLYWIMVDGATGSAVVDHRVSHSFVNLSTSNTVKAPGWSMALLVVSPRALDALGALNQTTVDQLDIALESELAKSANRRDLSSAYLFVRHVE
ncbi:MAG: serine/threonine-protein kinase [Aliidongia sp.]